MVSSSIENISDDLVKPHSASTIGSNRRSNVNEVEVEMMAAVKVVSSSGDQQIETLAIVLIPLGLLL